MGKPSIVIAGASGFIGRWFIEQFHEDFHIIALSRSKMRPAPGYKKAEWRQVELYSLSSTEKSVKGADYALYLVHSMQPNTRLHQGVFEDTDLLLADNFGRAAASGGIRQIIFMGGLLPDDEPMDQLSRHLRSRWEVERTLGSAGVPVTALRAGIIVGAGGSSFNMIKKLVRRIPVLICPAWCQSATQPVDLHDALKMIRFVIGNEDTYNRHFDIGGSDTTSYMEMIRTVADLMGKRRIIQPVRFFTPGLSKYWVATFSGQSSALVSPLIDSLQHDMVASPNALLEQFPVRANFRESAQRALSGKDKLPPLPERIDKEGEKNTVRSIQRLPNPGRHTATYVARIYQRWLPIFFRTLIRVHSDGDVSRFTVGGVPLLKLTFVPDRSDEERQLFYITGGKLVKRRDYGWLEFRRVLEGRYVISAIHEFVPALPWFIYVGTQARAHTFVMKKFGKYLAGK